MKKAVIILLILAGIGGGGYAYYVYSKEVPDPTVTTGVISRGNIIDTVGTTGALSAVSQVLVGAQVSGIIEELHADFNSIVKKGQLLAKLDPSTIETQILQAQANLTRSQTDLDRAKVSLEDAKKKFDRSKELFAKGIVNQADYDTAELTLRTAQSSLKSSEASLKQSEASLEQNKVNMEHTRIYSPIDGLVISRAVDVGQTVSASMQAPTLFTIAADLTKMKVIAGVDESDVGRIRPNQHVTFRVDAYPSETFNGTVEQVRLEPKLQQNVVTYQTVISAPNPQLKLKPGMTANINIEIGHAEDVLRVPNAALRFRPTNDMYVALGITPPTETGRGRGGFGRGGFGADSSRGFGSESPANGQPSTRANQPAAGQPAGASAPAARANAPATAQDAPRATQPAAGGSARGGNGADARPADAAQANGDRMARFRNMTPEEREKFFAERRAAGGGADGGRWGGQGGRGGNLANGATANGGFGRGGGAGERTAASAAARPAGSGAAGSAAASPAKDLIAGSQAATIDALFPPLPPIQTRGRVWLWDKDKKALTQVPLVLGVTDGQMTQILDGNITEGTAVVTNIILASSVRPDPNQPAQQQGNPFLQQQGRGDRGGGFRRF